jgi:hypothetical protein
MSATNVMRHFFETGQAMAVTKSELNYIDVGARNEVIFRFGEKFLLTRSASHEVQHEKET